MDPPGVTPAYQGALRDRPIWEALLALAAGDTELLSLSDKSPDFFKCISDYKEDICINSRVSHVTTNRLRREEGSLYGLRK